VACDKGQSQDGTNRKLLKAHKPIKL
jgi:hypothetical protein